jgi:hypothetical protein
MDWIDNGYRLLWETAAPAAKESSNAPSAFEHKDFVNDAIKEMVESGALTRLPRGQRPTVVSPIGVVTKPHSDKFRLVINMRYVNKHLAKRCSSLRDWWIWQIWRRKAIIQCPMT